MSTIAIQSLTFHDHFVRHANFMAELTPVGNDLDRLDATFYWSPGLADGNLVSFESRNFSGHFLRHQDFRVTRDEVQRWATDNGMHIRTEVLGDSVCATSTCVTAVAQSRTACSQVFVDETVVVTLGTASRVPHERTLCP